MQKLSSTSTAGLLVFLRFLRSFLFCDTLTCFRESWQFFPLIMLKQVVKSGTSSPNPCLIFRILSIKNVLRWSAIALELVTSLWPTWSCLGGPCCFHSMNCLATFHVFSGESIFSITFFFLYSFSSFFFLLFIIFRSFL